MRRQQAARYADVRLALLGDAAHVVHPLAGQGLNLGLLDAAAIDAHLAARGISALSHPQTALQRYARQRRSETWPMLTATHELNRLFGFTSPTLTRLREQGLRMMEHCAPLKHYLMAHAKGERGDLPALARAGLD